MIFHRATNWRKLLFVIAFGVLGAFSARSQVFDLVVDAQGNGDYTTIQSALDQIPDNLTTRYLVFVKSGVYQEKVWLKSSKANVSLIGENVEKVIITWDDYQGKDGMSGANSYTFLAEGNDLYMENITIKNEAGPVGQAVAIRTTGNCQVFKNCRFLGNQDTYYAHKNRQYNYRCLVEGNTDFIYGDATAVFDSCQINCITGGSYISAPADTKLISHLTTGDFYHGLLFTHCDVTANEDVPSNSFYLGRPWQPNASSVFIQCRLGDHIKPEGWSVWGNDNHLSGTYAEYKNTTPEGELVDVSQRVDWSSQLSDSQVADYYNLNFFLMKNWIVWDPTLMTQTLKFPSNLNVVAGILSWDAVPEAIGYVIYRDDSVIGFTTTNNFPDEVGFAVEDYTVLSVSSNGNLSDGSGDGEPTSVIQLTDSEVRVVVVNGELQASAPVDVAIFSLEGKQMIEAKKVTSLSLASLRNGIYIVKITEREGNNIIKKIVYRR